MANIALPFLNPSTTFGNDPIKTFLCCIKKIKVVFSVKTLETMKKVLFISVMVFWILDLNAQTDPLSATKGDLFVINKSANQNYRHLDLPRANFIIKKGGIANYKSIVGTRVRVTGVKRNKSGETAVILKREDGRKFFNSFPSITANLDKAIEEGELSDL